MILIFIVTATQAQASFGPFQGPYDEPDNHGADVIASAVAIMPALAAGAVCGAVLLPADIYWEIAHPEDDFASAISATACVYPAMAVGYPIYLIVGLPLFGVQQLSHLTEEAPSEP